MLHCLSTIEMFCYVKLFKNSGNIIKKKQALLKRSSLIFRCILKYSYKKISTIVILIYIHLIEMCKSSFSISLLQFKVYEILKQLTQTE